LRVWPGQPYPLGATWDGQGVNFAIFSESATGVELCLFAHEDDAVETHKIMLRERTDQVWHCYLPDVRPGHYYGFRAPGPYDPRNGQRFNPAKLLIDPYAKAITGTIKWSNALFAYKVGGPRDDLYPDPNNSAGGVPKCVVIDPAFTWEDDRPLRIPWNRTVIYECHVKGMTKLHPEVPDHLRGTYLGLCTDPMIEYLIELGVTAVELLPVHQFVVDRHLAERGLTNYWGYNSIGFFAPDVRYASKGLGNQVYEFKSMVKTFHSAGIEVILDVVYNHTGEGNHLGPTLSLRGIDNRAYYRLEPNDPRFYVDFTGTGNSLNMQHPRAIQLIMDSLRYWVTDMHVDGFRFDLAPVLARELHEMDRLSAFFDIIHQDPTLANVKLIAEPWDVGPGGYQVGNFPIRWAEWNGRYRDAVRHYWRGDPGQTSEFASRLAGSSDIYQPSGRGAYASINFITAHDGFSLRDLVSYEQKHNEANGENNRDGHNDNVSRNWGVEGETDDSTILDRRFRVMRAFLATLAFSQGVPMLSHGDEIGRTQKGNNNAYAQDNELTWMHWDLSDDQRRLLAFARKCIHLRHAHAVLRRRHFFTGEPTIKGGPKDLSWLRPDGREMTNEDWHNPESRALGMLIYGEATDETDDRGRPIAGETLLLLTNSGESPVCFTLPAIERPPGPAHPEHGLWTELVDTTHRELAIVESTVEVGAFGLTLVRYGVNRRTGNSTPTHFEVVSARRGSSTARRGLDG